MLLLLAGGGDEAEAGEADEALALHLLRAENERLSVSGTTSDSSEQVTALEDKLARAEKAAGAAQRELGDLKRNLERASEKAVKEGGARASAETKVTQH